MNNGHGQNGSQSDFNGLVPFQPNAVITPETYTSNVSRLQTLKDAIALYEEQNNQAFMRYLEEKRRLEDAVEQGRLAAERLAAMNSTLPAQTSDMLSTTTQAFIPPGTSMLPSTSTQPYHPSQYPGQAPYHYSEIPSSARIVELPNSTQGSPQVEHVQSSTSAAWQQNNSQPNLSSYSAHQSAHSFSSQRGGTYQQYESYGTNPMPHTTSNSAEFSSQRNATYQQHQSYGTNHSSSSFNSAHYRPHTINTSHGSTVRGQSGNSHSVQPPPPSHGASTSQSAMAASSRSSLPTQSGITQPTSNTTGHANAAYGYVPSGGTDTSSGATGQPPPEGGIDQRIQLNLYAYFQQMDASQAKKLLVHALLVIHREQTGSAKTAVEQGSEGKLTPQLLDNVRTITAVLKRYPLSEVRALFGRIVDSLTKAKYVPGPSAQPQSHRPQDYVQRVPRATPSAISNTTSIHGQPTGTQLYTPSISSSTASSRPTVVPPSVARQQANQKPTPPITVSTTEEYTPRDAEAPHVRYLSPQPPPQASNPTWMPTVMPTTTPAISSTVAPAETLLHMPASSASYNMDKFQILTPSRSQSSPKTPRSEGPGDNVHNSPRPQTPPLTEERPKSPWSPDKADKSRLALDIIRSLGRPMAVKRKPSLTGSPSPAKRQRTHVEETDGPPMGDVAKEVPEDEQSGANLEVAAVGHGIEQHIASVEPLSPERSVPMLPVFTSNVQPSSTSVDETIYTSDANRATGRIQERAKSITPSEADVQETVLVSEPQSVGSEPPPSPPPRTTKSPSLGAVLEEVTGVNLGDTTGQGQGDPVPVGAAAFNSAYTAFFVPSSSTASSQPSSSTTPPRVEHSNERVPLFLPSPSSSPAQLPRSQEDDGMLPASASWGKPHDRKGKGKARQVDGDIDFTVSDSDGDRRYSPSVKKTGRRMAYVLVPPLPAYARRWSATIERASSVDELAVWSVDEEDHHDDDDEAAQAAAELSYSRLCESPCRWIGCKAVLNSVSALQKHTVMHAGDQEEWGAFKCQWHGCLSDRFVDKAGLVKHLQKHTTTPLRCAYEGCDQTFDAPDKLLQHHQSNKHVDDRLRPSWIPSRPPDTTQPLPPIPGIVPAYMSVPCRVSKHPMSRERHLWLGRKVLKNIMCYNAGSRSNKAAPSESKRLAEKGAVTVEDLKRRIEDEYVNFSYGYDASKRWDLHCSELPSGDVSEMVQAGLVLFAGDVDKPAEPSANSDAPGPGPGTSEATGHVQLPSAESEALEVADASSEPAPHNRVVQPAREDVQAPGAAAGENRPRLVLKLPRRTMNLQMPVNVANASAPGEDAAITVQNVQNTDKPASADVVSTSVSASEGDNDGRTLGSA